jgi:hypothetical protein
LGFDQLLVLNFRRWEVKFGLNTRKIKSGLSYEEYTSIWEEILCWVEDLQHGACAQWTQVQEEFHKWYARAIEVWSMDIQNGTLGIGEG